MTIEPATLCYSGRSALAAVNPIVHVSRSRASTICGDERGQSLPYLPAGLFATSDEHRWCSKCAKKMGIELE